LMQCNTDRLPTNHEPFGHWMVRGGGRQPMQDGHVYFGQKGVIIGINSVTVGPCLCSVREAFEDVAEVCIQFGGHGQ